MKTKYFIHIFKTVFIACIFYIQSGCEKTLDGGIKGKITYLDTNGISHPAQDAFVNLYYPDDYNKATTHNCWCPPAGSPYICPCSPPGNTAAIDPFQKQQANSNGEYEFNALKPEEFIIVSGKCLNYPWCSIYRSATKSFTIEGGKTITFNIELK